MSVYHKVRSIFIALACVFYFLTPGYASNKKPAWNSSNRYRVLLEVDPQNQIRSYSPASVDIDFTKLLADAGASGTFDEHTIEIVACDKNGNAVVYDSSREGDDKYLIPWRIDKYYGINRVVLNFVMPDHEHRDYVVYFDTVESGKGKPQRYHGLVGDGDYFSEGYKRRGVVSTKMDNFCDFDNDGDLDLFRVTTEPFIYCWENIGGNRYIEKGRMTSGGKLFVMPNDGFHRSWATLEFADWDNDGDQDLFVSLSVGPKGYENQFVIYENTTEPGGVITFAERGFLQTAKGNKLGSEWFATMKVVDWDGDGKKDIVASRKAPQGERRLNEYHTVRFYKNINQGKNVWDFILDEGINLQAGDETIDIHSPDVEVADLDQDGDLDLLTAEQNSKIKWYENIGTRTKPKLAAARDMTEPEVENRPRGGGHSGITVADFDGDGLNDYLIGHLWSHPPESRGYYKNVGKKGAPKFEFMDVHHGAPYTEQYQKCYIGRQNVVRASDWNNDGRTDLIATFERIASYYFRNLSNHLYPIFAVKQQVLGREVEGAGRIDICDWNNDGKKDLLAASPKGYLTLFLNQGTDAEPRFGKGERVYANGKPIDGTLWCNVMVCDWDLDGKKDVIFGMGGSGMKSEYYDWPHLNENPSQDSGFLFYRNIGTDAKPELAYPKWIKAGGELITYIRPNVGSYVDWDGDGKKDFIACGFENVIRFYKNIGSGKAGEEPEFAAGQIIVKPWTAMLISGAHAMDWNRDGDLDIVTGQGHGGVSLRFFERDYIEDTINNTRPTVKVTGFENK